MWLGHYLVEISFLRSNMHTTVAKNDTNVICVHIQDYSLQYAQNKFSQTYDYASGFFHIQMQIFTKIYEQDYKRL